MQFVWDIRTLRRAIEGMLRRGGGIAANLILAHMLTPAIWGMFIAILCASQALYRLMNISAVDAAPQDRRTASRPWLAFALAACALALSIVLSHPIADFFGAPGLQPWLIAAGVGAVTQFVAGYGSATLPGADYFRGMTIGSAGASAAYLLLLVCAWASGFRELWTVVAAFIAVQLCSAFWNATRGLNSEKRLAMSQYLTALFPALSFFVLAGELSHEAGVGALAGLSVALSLAQLVPLAAGAVSRRLNGENENGVRPSELGHFIKVVTASAVISMLAVAALAPDATPVLFGATYAPAVDSVFIALMAAGIQSVKQGAISGLSAERRVSLALLNSVVTAALAVPLGFRLIPDYGLGGFLIAQGLSEVASTAVLLVILAWRSWRSMPVFDVILAYGVLALALAATAAGHWTAESSKHLSIFVIFLDAAIFIGAYGLIGRDMRERLISHLCGLLPSARPAPGRSK